MLKLVRLAIARQDYELASYFRTLADQGGSEVSSYSIIKQMAENSRAWLKLRDAAGATGHAVDPAKVQAQASYVLNCDIDKIKAHHPEHEDIDAESVGALFDESARSLAHASKVLLLRISEMQANFEATRQKSLTCCFCNQPFTNIEDLREHSAACLSHPLSAMQIPTIDLPASQLPDMVQKNLPPGYTVHVNFWPRTLVVQLFRVTDYECTPLSLQRGLNFAELMLHCVNTARQLANLPPHTLPVTLVPYPPAAAEAMVNGELPAAGSLDDWAGGHDAHGLPVCPKCGKTITFEFYEPFASCDCGTTEWGNSGDGYRRLQAAKDGPLLLNSVRLSFTNSSTNEELELLVSTVTIAPYASVGPQSTEVTLFKLIGKLPVVESFLTEAGNVAQPCCVTMTVIGSENQGVRLTFQKFTLNNVSPLLSNGDLSIMESLTAIASVPTDDTKPSVAPPV